MLRLGIWVAERVRRECITVGLERNTVEQVRVDIHIYRDRLRWVTTWRGERNWNGGW